MNKNTCQFCKTVCCCAKCLKKHQVVDHDVNPDCDICLYGYTYFSRISENLLDHVNERHFPLHCVVCDKLFGNYLDLTNHNKCPLIAVKTPKHDLKGNVAKDYSLKTSTPMHGSDDSIFLQNISEFISPVDNTENVAHTEIFKTEKLEINQKRRVTFTAIVEESYEIEIVQSSNRRSSVGLSDASEAYVTCNTTIIDDPGILKNPVNPEILYNLSPEENTSESSSESITTMGGSVEEDKGQTFWERVTGLFSRFVHRRTYLEERAAIAGGRKRTSSEAGFTSNSSPKRFSTMYINCRRPIHRYPPIGSNNTQADDKLN